MTIKENGYEKFAFLPKVCDRCHRKFIFEPYHTFLDFTMEIPYGVPKYLFCGKCAKKFSILEMADVKRHETIVNCLPDFLRR